MHQQFDGFGFVSFDWRLLCSVLLCLMFLIRLSLSISRFGAGLEERGTDK